MGYEVELKYRDADHAELTRRLLDLGAGSSGEVVESDTYLAHPSRDFALTGEAFRIRVSGEACLLTYKGPKAEGPTKTREEVELAFEAGPDVPDQALRMVEALGFEPVAIVRKSRLSFSLERDGRSMTVTLDRAEGLGDFAEVEALAEGPDLAGAQAAVVGLAGELGLEPGRVEPKSYLRMHLEATGRLG